jgi:hypothetical protein
MKKRTKKLVLTKETVLRLEMSMSDFRQVRGGSDCDTCVPPVWSERGDACNTFECNTAPCYNA